MSEPFELGADVSQYSRVLISTNKNDKNGVEVFEEDICKVYHMGAWHFCRIVYGVDHKKKGSDKRGEAMFSTLWRDGYLNDAPINAEVYEVVGNYLIKPEIWKQQKLAAS